MTTPEARKPCSREGCLHPASGRSRWCSFVCKQVDREMDAAQRICNMAGNTPQASELWCNVVELSDVLTKVKALKDEIYQAAMDVGMSNEQWHAAVHPRQSA